MITYMSVKQSLLMLSCVSLITSSQAHCVYHQCYEDMFPDVKSRSDCAQISQAAPRPPLATCAVQPLPPVRQEKLSRNQRHGEIPWCYYHINIISYYTYYHMKYILTFKIVFSQ